MTLKTIRLYGPLGRRFGRVHRLDCADALDAVRALCALHPGFRKAFAQGHYLVKLDGATVTDREELRLPAADMRFLPQVSGAGHGVGEILLGAAMIVAAFYTGGASLAGGTLTTTAMGSMALSFGATLVLGGLSQMLTHAPQTNLPNSQNSTAFSGPVNTTAQGNPVPILYGRLMIGSQVVSASLQSFDVPIGQTPGGQVTTTTKSGGTLTYTTNQSAYLGGS